MDSKEYLKSYGWREGEALKIGGLKKPILVRHKKDKKGLGGAAGHEDGEAWWERLFDGHLKGLDVNTSSDGNGITFKQKEVIASGVAKNESPLYKWFVRGDSLKGTIDLEKAEKTRAPVVVVKRKREDNNEETSKKIKKKKQEKQEEKAKKEKKEKKQKKKKKTAKKENGVAVQTKKDGKHTKDRKDRKDRKEKDNAQ